MQIPNPIKFFKSMAIAVWWKLRGYEVLSTPQTFHDRWASCMTCDHFDSEFGQCKKCGCLMLAKANLNSETCPVGRWGRVYRKRLK